MSVISSKPHFPALDGLRGVAALMVVAFHLFEVHSTSHLDQLINHGYLAVDFFFLLSGFVVGYAYDDRWTRMSVGEFCRRRLVRLQPMVVLGMLIGALTFYGQANPQWPLVAQTSVGRLVLITLLGCLMLPVPPSLDVRGWQETFPLNGPGWSLFFEYVANLLYAVVVRHFPRWALAVLVAVSAAALLHLALTNGDVVGGWALEPVQLRIGFSRVMFPFFGGLLLFRTVRPGRIPHGFLWSSLLLIILLAMPRIGAATQPWQNGLYEALCILVGFPLVVYLGISSVPSAAPAERVSQVLGELSYPLYITHFPFVYLYFAWVHRNGLKLQQGTPVAAAVLLGTVALAYACLKFYDEPVRTWLSQRVLRPARPVSQKG
ncbi:acyltransferase family protein [Hymenobacter pini]|uniref:acyltransferase family protein n=1 Tax=Hymenobacter pini TaxID=2880879 RepID=UPI001CF5A0A0|nr:acyltransferase [Hymenobacter pini]MCA8829934.1 acyltransferase [Hymenobacter pini]